MAQKKEDEKVSLVGLGTDLKVADFHHCGRSNSDE